MFIVITFYLLQL